VNYNNEKQRFLDTYGAIKKVNKDAQKLLDLLKEVSVVQASLAEDFYELYESKAELYNATLKYQDVTKQCDASRQQFDDQLRGDFIEPISKYIGQYKEMKRRIEEVEVRKVDMDRYSRDVRTGTEKGKGGMTTKEQKAESAKVNYQNLHDELLRDLPLLYEDRIPFFNPALATYLTGVSEFSRSVAKSNADSAAQVNHINRGSIHDHPRITTPSDISSAKFKTTSPNMPHKDNTSSSSSSTSNASHYQTPPHTSTATAPTTSVTQQSSESTGRALPMPNLPTKPNNLGAPKASALFDFNAQESNELSFKGGDILTIVKQNGDWWEGELNGKRGLLPSNYVKLL